MQFVYAELLRFSFQRRQGSSSSQFIFFNNKVIRNSVGFERTTIFTCTATAKPKRTRSTIIWHIPQNLQNLSFATRKVNTFEKSEALKNDDV